MSDRGRIGMWQRRVAAIRGNFLLALGMGIVLLSLILTAIGPYIAPYDPQIPTKDQSAPPPGIIHVPTLLWKSMTGQLPHPVHWFGTDAASLDVFSAVIAAPRTDVVVGIAATVLSLLLGTLLGLIAGYYRNIFTELLMRTSDTIQSFPVFILAMMFVTLSGRSVRNIIFTLAILYVPIFVRLTRSEVLNQRGREYVAAARVAGNREIGIALRHVLRNSMRPTIIQASVTIGWAILLTAGISFVGAGVRPPTPEWGSMISTGAGSIILGQWWPSLFPGIAIAITVFGFATIGNLLEERYAR